MGDLLGEDQNCHCQRIFGSIDGVEAAVGRGELRRKHAGEVAIAFERRPRRLKPGAGAGLTAQPQHLLEP